ncbi:MAG: helix-turn-helix transcriptional regulator [Lachnospiraceae bacterium]|nr:helix-turn-helix transcriptional regulator [Lachnospiraceae bacterium]
MRIIEKKGTSFVMQAKSNTTIVVKKYYERLKDLREAKNLTQKEVARAMGISERCYSYYEQGKRAVTVEMLVDFAKFYGISLYYLTGQINEKRPFLR